MRPKVFLDTNILLSGIFFEGNESHVLELLEIDLLTCEDVVNELYIVILPNREYRKKFKEAEGFITHKKDIQILAAVLYAKPDYFLTGDSHFFTVGIRNIVNVMTAKDFIQEVKKK